MFNSPILDTAIGLVFVFLLYSLLATSIQEALATLFSFRARMLKKGIVDGMLSNTKVENLWIGSFKTVGNTFMAVLRLIFGYHPKDENKIGHQFYNHPIIKNYGSRNRFALPSYIPTGNFSTVLIDVLKDYYTQHEKKIATYVQQLYPTKNIDLKNAATVTKFYYLVDYLLSINPTELAEFKIDKDTLKILKLHLDQSYQNLEEFSKKIENWFDDSMNRVAGWYKRQTQFLLFAIGLVIAVMFNVDVLEIANKLSTDKDARDKLVQMAIKATEQYKDDPRVKLLAVKIDASKDTNQIKALDTSYESMRSKFETQQTEIKNMLNKEVEEANNLLAIGWKDYGLKADSANNVTEFICEINKIKADLHKDTLIKPMGDTSAFYTQKALEYLYNDHWVRFKVSYVLCNAIKGRKKLGFLVLAFAVCVGAPFWFDMLNKLIKLRSAGKKEDTDAAQSNTTTQPVQVNVNNNQNTEEAVG